MPQFDASTFASQIFWLAVTFVALYFVMARVVVPRIAEVLDMRRRRIEANLEKAAALKKDAQVALEAYEKAIGAAREQARGLIAETGQRLAETAARQEAETAKTLARQVAESEAGIARAVEAALAGVREAAAATAADVAFRLMGEQPDRAEAEKAVDRALKTGV
jgi:F-type H+-transporting ATPase subunit b